MALPNTFANQTTPSMQELDQNFAAVGALTVLPCSVTGTNSINLTLLANTPSVAAYVNYMQFSGVFSGTSTGAMTARVGALPVLNVYKDTAAGPVLTAAGDGFVGNFFTLVYDRALNSGAGGFHLQTSIH